MSVVSDIGRDIPLRADCSGDTAEEKSIKIVEDIFLSQIVDHIHKHGVHSLAAVDFYNFKGIVLHRKKKLEGMRNELMVVVDIKKNMYVLTHFLLLLLIRPCRLEVVR